MKTIAQQLKIKDFPFVINDKDGKEIYFEESDGWWIKTDYDKNIIRFENSNNFWNKREYDAQGEIIYYEDSNGNIKDDRPKIVELTLEEIADKMGIKVEQLRIKE